MSLSKIKQARAFRPRSPSKLHTDGFHCSFTFEPLKCHICELIPREAYKVNCCERHYCKVCISSLEENYSTCPGCGKTITYSHNKKYNDVILRFEVYCKNRCDWKGPLGEHDRHLNIDPADDQWLNGCPTVTVTCIYCKKWNAFQRKRSFFLSNQHLDSTFETSKLDAIYKITIEVKNLWHEVGVALGLEEVKLKTIGQRCSNDSSRYQELLKEWIQSRNGANWKKLLCAFRSSNVQAATLSKKVERMIVCGVASELEVKELKEEAESLLQHYVYNRDSSHTRDNMQKCYQSLNDEIRYLEWEENAKLLDKGFGESQRKRFHHKENEQQIAAKMVVGGAAIGTAAGVGMAGAVAATTAEFVVGGIFLGPLGLAGGLMVGGIAAALTIEQQRKRKQMEDKYTKLIDTCKEKIKELRPKI